MKRQGSAAIAIALLVASCSSGSPASTTVAALPTTTTTTTLATTPTTRTEPTTTTASSSTTLASDSVGSAEALAALLERVVMAEVGLPNIGEDTDIPVLDANRPDALAALLSNIAFEDWVYKTFPDPAWAEVLAVPDSPAFYLYRTQFDSERASNVRWEDVGDPFTVESAELLEVLPLESDALELIPEGSVSFLLDTSRGAYNKVRMDTGEVVEERPGWESIRLVVVMARTDVGWQVYLSEVLER